MEAAYDMDNVRLAQMPDHQKTLTARYELTSLPITGSCEDVSSHDPPAGCRVKMAVLAGP